jgi:hypothetical protein
VDCLLLRVAHLAGLTPARSSLIHCATLAAKKAVNFRGIPKNDGLVNRFGALIARGHFASPVQGGDRSGVQIATQRRSDFVLQ